MMSGLSPQNYTQAQSYCKNAGGGGFGRLATFSSCSAYEAIKSNLPMNPSKMWIGIQEATDGPYWEDPYGNCTKEMFNVTAWANCSGSNWMPSGEKCIRIAYNWGELDGRSCSNTYDGILCEFGKFEKLDHIHEKQ